MNSCVPSSSCLSLKGLGLNSWLYPRQELREKELLTSRAADTLSPMSSFGVAIKHGVGCGPDKEVVVFEHTLSAHATHGVITQMWHGGTRGDPRMRVYVDEEVGTNHAAVDYTVSLAHGLAPVRPANCFRV